jgi:beta-lactamase superfamily II metal-dependent hydrolase
MLLNGGFLHMPRRKRPNLLIKFISVALSIVIVCIVFYNIDFSSNFTDSFNSSSYNSDNSYNFKPENFDELLLYVMDTGNSDSLLLIDPSGQTMLIDAAEDDDYYKIKTTLDKYNVKRINALVATHPHADHIGAMDDIIKSFDVDAIYMTSFGDDTKVIEDLMDAVESMGVPKIFINTGMQFQLGKASVSVLGPEEGEPKEDANNESIVMMVSYGETDFLLTGDMEEKESYEILERWGKNVDCEILKVAHHGSRTGTTKAFLDAATPQIAIISCGENNPYGHPAEETLALLEEAGARTLRTDLLGDIAILTDGSTVQVFKQYAQ